MTVADIVLNTEQIVVQLEDEVVQKLVRKLVSIFAPLSVIHITHSFWRKVGLFVWQWPFRWILWSAW